MAFTIYDLEYTSWSDNTEDTPRQGYREIIAIAAIRANDDLTEADTFTTYVTPSQDVSEFIIDLTGISRATIRDGQSFSAALQAFNAFVDDTQAWSYGNDALVLGENIALNDCEAHTPTAPLNNIKPFINDADPETRTLNSGKLANHYGKALEGDEHDPLYDCRSILAALNALSSPHGLPVPLRRVFKDEN